MDLQKSFKILGLDPQANLDLAKRAYKNQVRRWHPDQFPQGSTDKAAAEERLKQINIAYAQVKGYLSQHRPEHADRRAETSPQSPPEKDRRPDSQRQRPPKRSWVDHLFDTLNAFAGNRTVDPPPSAAEEPSPKRVSTFDRVLDEISGGKVSVSSMRPRTRTAAGHRIHRHTGGTVSAVGGTERVGPVKPVNRVRGIGRTR